MAPSAGILIAVLSDWRAVAALVAMIAAISEARIRLQRLIELHKPEAMIAKAEELGRYRADFVTAQQDIVSLTKRIIACEQKVREDIKDVHAKIERNFTGSDD